MKKRNFSVLFCAIIIFCATSCATSISMNITRPAELDLNGAESISILPFQSSSSFQKSSNSKFPILSFFVDLLTEDYDQREILNYMKEEMESKLLYSSYYSLINSDSVQKSLEAGRPSPADVYITGRITRFKNDVEHEVEKRKDSEKTRIYDIYTRKVLLEFRYEIIDGRTNEIIYTTNFIRSETSNDCDDEKSLPSPFKMMKSTIDAQTSDMIKKIQPYPVTKYLSLLKDKTKSEDMKIADEMAKNGLVQESCNKYLEIYDKRHIFEAGYNAAVILEAQGKLEEAEELAEELTNKFADKKAYSLLQDIRFEISQNKKLKDQNAQRNKTI